MKWKNKSVSIFALGLMLAAPAAYADIVWTGPKKVVSINVVEHGGFLIQLDSDISPLCSHSYTSDLLIYPNQAGVTDAGVKSLLAVALTAFSAGNNVNIMYDNSTDYCFAKYLRIEK